QALGLEGRIAGRLRAERIEMRSEVAMHPNRLDQGHRGRDPAEELFVGSRRLGCRRRGRHRRGSRSGVSTTVGRCALEQSRETGLAAQEDLRLALDEVAAVLWNR